jgi:site-specific DNA-cytosine methylase
VQEDGTSPTISQHWGTGGNNVPFVGVRRLMPVECLRLQGFPDDYQEIYHANAKEENARKILHILWKSANKKTMEEWDTGIDFSLLTPEILLSGVHVGWISWKVAAECSEARRKIQGENYCTEGFVYSLWENEKFRCSPYRRESFKQCARELGSSMSELPYHYSQGWENMLNRGVRSATQGTWLLQQALDKMEETRRPNGLQYSQEKEVSDLRQHGERKGVVRETLHETEKSKNVTSISDTQRYKQLGNAVCVSVAEWIGHRIMQVERGEL